MKWFYLVTFKYPHGDDWGTQHLHDVLDMNPGETEVDVYNRINDRLIEKIGMFRFGLGHFVVYHVAENMLPYKGPR